jgi:hypothetical protein
LGADHTPDVMGYGVDQVVGPPYTIVTDKAKDNPIGDFVWLVGRTEGPDSPVYLRMWFVVNQVQASPIQDFLFQYVGERGGLCSPMPVVSDRAWFRQLLGMTGNFKFGLTEVKLRAVLNGLRAAAAEAGCPQE